MSHADIIASASADLVIAWTLSSDPVECARIYAECAARANAGDLEALIY